MLHVDRDQREIVASVRALAEWPPGPPRPVGWLSLARAELGTSVHEAYRADREQSTTGFTAEVTLRLEQEIDGFRVQLRGRLDGLIEEAGGLVVEEVKSVDAVEDPPTAAHLFQLRLYMLMLASSRPEERIRGRLVRISVVDGARRELDIAFEAARVTADLERRLRAVLADGDRRAERSRKRAALARRLVFPHPDVRRQQQELMTAFEAALEAARPVLARAPTGVGKTAAALLPALRHALSKDAPLFFATARTTQQELVARTFLDLAERSGVSPSDLTAVTLANKREMCPPGHLACHPDHCPLLSAFFDRDRREGVVRAMVEHTLHAGPEQIRRAAEAAGVCPYYLSLALCAEAELLIGDCNYVYSPSSALSHFSEHGPTVLIDEAHQLFDRAREHHSPFLRRSRLEVLARTDPPVEGFGALARDLLTRIDVAPASLLGPPCVALARRALKLAVRYAHVQRRTGPFSPDDPWLELVHTLVHLRSLVLDGGEEFLPVRERDGASGIGFLCLDPSRKLAERHQQTRGTIAMSATMTSLDHARQTLGFDDLDPVQISVGSPFPMRNRCVLLVRSVGTRYRERTDSHPRVARLIREITAVRAGHYAVYFPSFRYLDAVQAHLSDLADRLLVQRPGMSRRDQAAMLDRLHVDPDPLLLLAVLGGRFAEGIDLSGDALVGAIVVSPGLPPVGFERASMREYYDQRGGQGFAHAMLDPGMQRVVQAAGRVHRTSTDRGVIVLVGRRFAQRPYRDLLPRYWYRETPAELAVDDPLPRLRAFWGEPSRQDEPKLTPRRKGAKERQEPRSAPANRF